MKTKYFIYIYGEDPVNATDKNPDKYVPWLWKVRQDLWCSLKVTEYIAHNPLVKVDEYNISTLNFKWHIKQHNPLFSRAREIQKTEFVMYFI